MSKEVNDVMARLEGDLLALQGMRLALAPPPPAGPPTTEVQNATMTALPLKAKKEEYDYIKKLAEEIKGFCTTLEELVDKELKVPPPPAPEGSNPAPSTTPAAEPHKEAAGSHSGKK